MSRLGRLSTLGVLALVGCTLPPPQLYVLNPIAGPDTALPARSVGVRTLAILPVTIPDYLDRREIVARTADHKLLVSDGERWGEGLSAGLGRVLTVDLGKLLAKDGFVVTSGSSPPKVDAEVALTVDAFERGPDSNTVLAARWTIFDERRDGAARHFQAVYTAPVQTSASSGVHASAEVAALNRNLDRLAADMAASVRQVIPTGAR
ncbi:MAG: membrane integrity-associated transporter subunit PqiC [Alphaproteobacteria bacterium]|nr:membrane integrity-associated transporter subunit PqiC [Alphaproteobacteria bacterium]